MPRFPPTMPVRDRLLAKRLITPSGCWEWTGACNAKGYGIILLPAAASPSLVHRVAFQELVGPIPTGLCVLHHCDNPPCFNPACLYAGSKADNQRDAMTRGRWEPHRGATHPRAKLSDEQVRAIRADTRSSRKIAADYGVSHHHVLRLKHGHQRQTS